jgi:NLR family CARD domain-containing protein 3
MMEESRQKLILNSEHTLQLTSTLNHDDLDELASLLEVNSSIVSVEISNSKVFHCDKLMAVFERKQNILTYEVKNISQHVDFVRFGELIVRNGSIVDLKFHTWTSKLDLKAIEILTSALRVNKTIQSLEIVFNGFCLASLERLMEAVSCIPSLTKLKFCFSSNDSSISVAPITRFVSNNDTLTYLCVNNSRDGVGVMELVRVLQNNNSIRSFDIRNSKVKDVEIAALLSTNSTITDLNVSDNDIGDDGVILIGDALLRNTSITRIDLSDNSIGLNGVKHLADAMTVNSTVTELELSGNYRISKKGADHLAHMLTRNSTVSTLFCGYCEFGETGLISMAAALSVNTTLQFIDLSFTRSSTASMIALAEALAVNSTLTTVNLDEMKIDAVGMRELCQGLQRNGSISTINLSLNNFGDEGARCIAALLESNSVISNLDVAHCGITDEGARAIAAALTHNTSITEFGMSGNSVDAVLEDEIECLIGRNEEIKQCHFSLK